MRSLFKLIFLVFFLSSCGGSDNHPTNTLQSSIHRFSQQYEIPGVLAGVWIPDQSPMIIEHGVSNKETSQPITRNDHTRIASVTKSFTTTVVLQLVQEGLIDLQKPLSFYLPDLSIQNNDATAFQLGAMTGGIFDYVQDKLLVSDMLENPLKQVDDLFLVDAANRNTPYFAPGAGWHYSNTKTVLLGMLIEKVTGNSVADEINNRIIRPLNLSTTTYPQTAEMPSPFLNGYLPGSSENFTRIHPSYSSASGAMISTLDDLRKWAVALGEGSLLSEEMQRQRLQSLVPIVFSPCFDEDSLRPPSHCPEYDKYGFGLGEINGWIGHTGSYLGYQTLVMYSPKSRAVIVILINQSVANLHIPTKIFKEWTETFFPTL